MLPSYQCLPSRQVETALRHAECLILAALVDYGSRPGQGGGRGVEEGHPRGVQDSQDSYVHALHVQAGHEGPLVHAEGVYAALFCGGGGGGEAVWWR